MLAVTYTLMLAWIEDALGKDEPEPLRSSLQIRRRRIIGTNRRLGPAGHASSANSGASRNKSSNTTSEPRGDRRTSGLASRRTSAG